MAELTHLYDDQDSAQTTTSGTYGDITGISVTPLANTTYLIIARALFGVDSITNKGYFRVETADDTTIEARSEMIVEFMETSSTGFLPYLYVGSFTSDGTPDTVNLQFKVDGSSTLTADQMSLWLLDLGAIGESGYWDGTVTDNDAAWGASPDNIANGNPALGATCTTTGSTSSNEIRIANNQHPTSGDVKAPVTIQIRGRRTSSTSVVGFEVFDGGDSLMSDTFSFFNAAGNEEWTQPFHVPAPSGGWTAAKMEGLEVVIWLVSGDGLFITQVDFRTGYVEHAPDGYVRTTGTDLDDDGTTDEYHTTEATSLIARLDGAALATDEWLVAGYATCTIASTGKVFSHSLYAAYDVSTAVEVTRHSAEGEDTTAPERRLSGSIIRHQASSGTPNVTLYGVDEAGGGAHNEDGGGYLIALPASIFADFEHFYTAGTIAIDGTETTIQTSGSYTPTVTGNHLIFGRSNGEGDPTALGGMWVESTTTEIRTGDAAPTHNQIWDPQDNEYQATFQRYSITTAETFNLRSQGAAANFDQEHRWLVIVNLNAAAGGTPATVTPGVIAATAALPAPTLVGTAVVTPGAVAAVAALPATKNPQVVTTSPVVGTAALPAPTLVGGAVATPGAVAAIGALPAPTTVGGAVVTPTTVAAVAALPATKNPQVVSASTVAAIGALPAVTTVGGAVVTPGAVAAVAALPAPTLVGGAVVTPGTVAAIAALPATKNPQVVSTSTVAALAALPAVTVAGGAVVTPGVVVAVGALPAVTILIGGTVVTPGAVAAIAALPAPTVAAGVVVTPGVVAAVAALPAVTIIGGAVVTPGAIAAVGALPAPTLVGGAVVTPGQIAAIAALPAVTIIIGGASALVTPDTIAAIAALPAVSVAAGVVVTPGAVAATATLPAPTLVGGAVVTTSSQFLVIPDLAGNNVRTPTHASLEFTGDFDLRVDLLVDPWLGTGQRPIMAKGASDATMGFFIGYTLAERWNIQWHDGTSLQIVESIVDVPAVGERVRVRATLDVDNDAVGHDVKFYKSTDFKNWTQLGATITNAGTTVVTANSNDLEFGADRNGTRARWLGRAYRGQVYDGIDGTLVADFDAEDFAAGDTDTDTAVDSTDKTWTIFGASTVATAAAGIDAAAILPAPTLAGGAVVTPGAVAAIAALPAVTIIIGGASATVTPGAVAAIAALPAPTIAAGVLVTPSQIAAIAALPAATTVGGAVATPGAVAAIAALPAVTTIGGAVVTPGAVAAIATLPAVTLATGAGVTPNTIAAIATLPAVTLVGGAVAIPGAIAAVAALPAATVLAGDVVVTPGVIAAIVAFPAVVIRTPPEVFVGNWYTLVGILEDARAVHELNRGGERVACPNDGQPLLADQHGLYCPYDGWRPIPVKFKDVPSSAQYDRFDEPRERVPFNR